jgi:hypothetical protein
MKLKVILLALGFASSIGAAQATNAGGGWSYAEATNPLTDLRTASARVRSNDGTAQLVFTCNSSDPGRLLSFQFLPRAYLGSAAGSVTLRADGGPLLTDLWDHVYRGAYISDQGRVYEIARAIADHDSLFVRALNYEGQPVDGTFRISGARPQIEAVLAACGKTPLAAVAK